jgi:multiple sugar transport system ATP-binding protein
LRGTDKTKTRVTPALRLSCLRGFEQLDLIVVLDNEIGEGSARVTRQSRALLFGMMNAGDLVQVGRPQEIYDRPCNIFVAQFVGTPSINLLNVTARSSGELLMIRLKGEEAPLGSIALPASDEVFGRLRMVGSDVILGVRPEAIAVLTEEETGAAPAEIELVEPMGSVNNIVLRLSSGAEATADGEPVVAVVTSNESRERGEKAWVRLRPERLVIFDKATGTTVAVLSDKRWEAI